MDLDSPLSQPWPHSVAEARAVQEALRGRVVRHDDLGEINRVAGVDIGIDRKANRARAAAAVLSYPGCDILETVTVTRRIEFPYVPGYLSFREVPPVMAALEALCLRPDLIICDGQGIAHPRRFGLACHLGILTNLPTIGAAKSRLIGTFEEPGSAKGDTAPLEDAGEIIGTVLRSRTNVQPIYVSPGHRVGLGTAVHIVLECCKRYRLPETTRAAHRLASG